MREPILDLSGYRLVTPRLRDFHSTSSYFHCLFAAVRSGECVCKGDVGREQVGIQFQRMLKLRDGVW